MILGFDTLDLLFLGATAWVGPFWIMMLAFPEHPLTVRMLRPPWFMLGPLVIYTGVGLTQASLMAEVLADLVRLNRVHEGFATIMGSVEGGAVMTWAHHPDPRGFLRHDLDLSQEHASRCSGWRAPIDRVLRCDVHAPGTHPPPDLGARGRFKPIGWRQGTCGSTSRAPSGTWSNVTDGCPDRGCWRRCAPVRRGSIRRLRTSIWVGGGSERRAMEASAAPISCACERSSGTLR